MSETKLTQGMQSFGSMRGVSGHVHNPFAGKFLLFFFCRLTCVITSFTHGFSSYRIVTPFSITPFLAFLFAAITIGTPSETHGEVRGFSFIYSGNFLVEAEMSEMGRLRVNVGINPMGLQWHLMPCKCSVLFVAAVFGA